jgi:hypothetical protein
MTGLVMACVVALGVLVFAPMKANAGVYIRAPYFSLNVNRPYYRPYRHYGYRPYYRPYYRRYWGRPYYTRRWRRWRRW